MKVGDYIVDIKTSEKYIILTKDIVIILSDIRGGYNHISKDNLEKNYMVYDDWKLKQERNKKLKHLGIIK